MQIEKLEEHVRPLDYHPVRLKAMGQHFEVRFGTTDAIVHTRKLDAEHYVVIETGEVKKYRHTRTRAESVTNVKQSMARLRDIIRANVDKPYRCRWITLTYQINQRDPAQLYQDYRKFNQRFKRYLKRNHNIEEVEWIAIVEPQARGSFHMHIIYIFPQKAPYIKNDDFAKIWGHGFTKFKALNSSDDVALYLTAYLCDLPLDEALKNGTKLSDIKSHDLKAVKVGKKTKAFIKGGRLDFYPKGMRIYRKSRGIKKPDIRKITEREAQEILAFVNADLTFEKTIVLKDSADKTCVIYNYRHYRAGAYNKEIENRMAL